MYAKIFASMWDGTLGTKWQGWTVFVYMLANCDREGFFDVAPEAIAARSGLPLQVVKDGIQLLESADPYSRRSDLDGVRIERIDEHRPWGWRIVNYLHYRTLVDKEMEREQAKERQRKHRQRIAAQYPSRNVTSCHAASRHAEAEAEEEAEDSDSNESSSGVGVPILLESKISKRVTSRVKPREVDGFAEWYAAYPRHVARIAAARAYATALKRATPDELMAGAQRYAREVSDRDPDKIKHPATWLNGGCWADEPAKPKVSYYQKLEAAARILEQDPERSITDGKG